MKYNGGGEGYSVIAVIVEPMSLCFLQSLFIFNFIIHTLIFFVFILILFNTLLTFLTERINIIDNCSS